MHTCSSILSIKYIVNQEIMLELLYPFSHSCQKTRKINTWQSRTTSIRGLRRTNPTRTYPPKRPLPTWGFNSSWIWSLRDSTRVFCIDPAYSILDSNLELIRSSKSVITAAFRVASAIYKPKWTEVDDTNLCKRSNSRNSNSKELQKHRDLTKNNPKIILEGRYKEEYEREQLHIIPTITIILSYYC